MTSLRAAVLLAALAGCAGGHAAPAPAAGSPDRPVRVAPAAAIQAPIEETVVGTVNTARAANVAATVTGTVAEVRVAVGSRVRAGDVLVRLSARGIDARLAQARAAYGLARVERDRTAALRAADAVSPAQRDAAESQLAVAAAAQAEASTMLEHTVLRAPFDGVVTAKLCDPGDAALPGVPLVAVAADQALRFEVTMPERLAAGLRVGQILPVALDGRDAPVAGTLVELAPTADPVTRTVLVKLELPRADGLRAGQFGRLRVAAGEREALVVPAAAVVRRGQLEEVYVVEAGAARLRLVRVARERDGQAEIASGLRAGEPVVVAGADGLTDGSVVRLAAGDRLP